jgi:hypothetical protein
MPVAVRVVGLAELRRDLRRVDAALPKELAAVNQQAGEVVAAEARRRAPKGAHQGGGRVSPISSTITAGRRQRAATVSIGGARSPHAPVYEFGGTIPRHHSSARTRVTQRAYLYPALEAKRTEVTVLYARLVEQLMSRAFPS